MAEFDIHNFKQRLKAINRFDGNLRFGAATFHAKTNRSGSGKPSSGGMTREQMRVVEDTKQERFRRINELWESIGRCPICDSRERELFISRYAVDIHKCRDCEHRYLDPRVKFEVAMQLYADDKTASDIYTQPMQVETDEIKYQYGLDLIDQLNPPAKSKIMDIGCGAGVFLKMAERNGWERCVGIDVNERYATAYRDISGVQFVSANFEALQPESLGSGYDCISMWSVLEHLYAPQAILRVLRGLIKHHGLLFILVPNVESLATRLMRQMSPTFTWKHISHFSAKTLKQLMASHGFECLHLETVITEIDNIKSYMSGEYPYHGYGDPAGLFDFITPDFIHKNLLGSRLIGIFRNA